MVEVAFLDLCLFAITSLKERLWTGILTDVFSPNRSKFSRSRTSWLLRAIGWARCARSHTRRSKKGDVWRALWQGSGLLSFLLNELYKSSLFSSTLLWFALYLV